MFKKLFLCTVILLMYGAAHSQTNNAYDDYIQKANAFYDVKQYAQSADAYSKAFAALGGKAYPADRYNAACSWARAGNKDSAFYLLNKVATKSGYSHYDHLIGDSDLMSLHTDKRWALICKLVKKNKDKIEAHYNRPLITLLDSVYKNDQGERAKIEDIQKKYGADSKEALEKWKTIREKDSVNFIIVEKILKKYGWVGPEVIGDKGSETLFLVIQHANLKAQEKYFAMLQKAVKNHKAKPDDLALLEDRVALREGKDQIYGSQITQDSVGNFLVMPMIDPDNVDKRRAKVGLGPMKDYVKHWNITWNVEEYKKQLLDMEKREKELNK